MLVKEGSEVVREWGLLGCGHSIAVEVAPHRWAVGLKNAAKALLLWELSRLICDRGSTCHNGLL
jgi:hypothetical protein